MTPNINLLPKQETNKVEAYRKQIFIAIPVVLIALLLIWQYVSARMELTELTDKEMVLLAQQSDLLSQIDTAKQQQQLPIETAAAFVEQAVYNVSPLIDEIHRLQGETMYLRTYSFGQNALSLTVDFEMLQDVSTFVKALNNSAYFSDAKVGTVQQFTLPNQKSETVEQLPRYSVDLELTIKQGYLAAGGQVNE